MQVFYRALRQTDRPFLFGYTHALHLFADFLERSGLHEVRAAGVVTGGMPLHAWQRKTIEKMLHCPVLNRYGCEELGTIACECREGRALHIQAYAKHVEVTDGEGNPLPDGEAGYLVVTDFDNAAMPFIRYRIEDMGVLTDRTCSCGRNWPLIERLEGRDSDFILTPDGKKVSGISLTDLIGVSIPGVFQLQLIQVAHRSHRRASRARDGLRRPQPAGDRPADAGVLRAAHAFFLRFRHGDSARTFRQEPFRRFPPGRRVGRCRTRPLRRARDEVTTCIH